MATEGAAAGRGRPRVGRNLVANLFAQGSVVALGLLLPPYFVKWMGPEAYGLVGFHTSLVAVFALFDVGLSAVLNRELARLSAEGDAQVGRMRSLVHTFGRAYWLLGAASALACWAIAPLVADRWVRRETLPREAVVNAVRMMGLLMALHWPQAMYNNALAGLQRQVVQSALQTAGSVLRSLGALAVLALVTRDVMAYFAVQLAVGCALTASLAAAVWSALGGRAGPRAFDRSLLTADREFAASSWALVISGVLLTQLDRVIISRALPLESLGYYTMAASVSSSVLFLATPVFNAILPRVTQLASAGRSDELFGFYRAAVQVLAVLLTGPCFVICFFAGDILRAWARSPVDDPHLPAVIVLLTAGATLRGMCHVPYALQLAHRWLTLNLAANVACFLVLAPLEWLLAARYGLRGAAVGPVLQGLFYFFVCVPLTHRKLLPRRGALWFARDVLPPALAALAVVAAGRWLLPPAGRRLVLLAQLAPLTGAAVAAAALAAPRVNALASGRLRALWLRGRAAAFAKGP
jgi:O-antigen/teichoic acid export membrane protein